MRDSTHGKGGIAWGLMFLIRFFCSRRGAALGRASIVFSTAVLAGLIALGATVGKWGLEAAWARFTAMEENIAKIQNDLREFQMTAGFRVGARDRQVNAMEGDIDKLQDRVDNINGRVIRLEAQAR